MKPNNSSFVLGFVPQPSLQKLAYLPLSLRRLILEKFRAIRPKDYTEVVRNER